MKKGSMVKMALALMVLVNCLGCGESLLMNAALMLFLPGTSLHCPQSRGYRCVTYLTPPAIILLLDALPS